MKRKLLKSGLLVVMVLLVAGVAVPSYKAAACCGLPPPQCTPLNCPQ